MAPARPVTAAAPCALCEKHRGAGPLAGVAIYEDDLVLAYHAPPEADGAYLGYVFVETRRHVAGLAARTDDEVVAEARLVTRVAAALTALGAEHVYSFVFDHVAHHHAHVVARHPGAPREYWGWRVDEWPGAPRADASALGEYCGRLAALLR
ncbi:MAG TPA: hypothetical protein VFN59_05300 [Acidimicrobiales bacterium]|nr:hypothetical protein [Acidimicrobiales bacterium]